MYEMEKLQKDGTTGAFSREYLFPVLKSKISDAHLHKRKLSILLVDIDHFKKVNEKYGHLWGDEFLRFEISTLRSVLQTKGRIFRYGGDEFVAIFSTLDPNEAFLLAKQFNMLMERRPFLFNGRLFKITVSCGLATYPDDAQKAKDLIKAADKALYFSKRSGRNDTTRASKIGFKRFKIIFALLLRVSFIAALLFFINTYFFKTEVKKTIKASLIERLLSAVFKTDTKVILKNGTIIKGHHITEDQNRLIIITPLNKEHIEVIFRKLEPNSDYFF